MPHSAHDLHHCALPTTSFHPLPHSLLIRRPTSQVQHSATVSGLVIAANHFPIHPCSPILITCPHHSHSVFALVPPWRGHVPSLRFIPADFCRTPRAPQTILRADNIVLHTLLPFMHFAHTANFPLTLVPSFVVRHHHTHVCSHSRHVVLVHLVIVCALCPVCLHYFFCPLLLQPCSPGT